MYTAKRIKAILHLCDAYALLTAFSVCLCLCGCTDNELVCETPQPEKNSDAVVSVNVKQQTSDQVITRTLNEDAIHDVHVLVYNSSGSLTGQGYTTGNSLDLLASKGTNCTIFAIANTGNPTLFNGVNANTIEKLKTFTSRELTLTNGVITNGLENDNYLLMSGCLTNQTLNATNPTLNLKVNRLGAKIKFKITAQNGITITGYSLKNLPNKEYLIANPYINESSPSDLTAGNDAATAWLNPNGVSLSSGTTAHSFNFYMYENRRGGRKTIDGIGDVNDQKQKAKYAPDNSTYVEITAKGSSNSSDIPGARFTSAIYRIYLGADNSQNYNVNRNCTYDITANIITATDIDTRVTKVSLPSNCYMVKPNSYVLFPAFTVNTITNQRVPLGTNWDAKLLWADQSNYLSTIKTVTAINADGTIMVETGSAEGNAVIVAKVGNDIVWSWHIWVTNYDPYTTNRSFNSKVFMDRNLGAINNTQQNVGSLGLLYQWGRKDPFPGASGITSLINTAIYGPLNPVFQKILAPNTRYSDSDLTLPLNNIDNSIKNPLLFYYTTSTTHGANKYDWYSTTGQHEDNLWGATGSKSVYDPSPEGWRVPTSGTNASSPWNNLSYPGSANFINGYNWASVGWYPATGYLDYNSGNLLNVGIVGIYWSASVKDETDTYSLYLNSSKVRTSNLEVVKSKGTYRSYGFPIRCVKE